MIPILLNHDAREVIGFVEPNGVGRLIDSARISRDQLFEIFGGAGIRLHETFIERGVIYVRRFEIMEFSMCSAPSRAVG